MFMRRRQHQLNGGCSYSLALLNNHDMWINSVWANQNVLATVFLQRRTFNHEASSSVAQITHQNCQFNSVCFLQSKTVTYFDRLDLQHYMNVFP